MKRRALVRRLFVFAGTLCVALVIVGYLIGLRWSIIWLRGIPPSESVGFGVIGGALHFSWWPAFVGTIDYTEPPIEGLSFHDPAHASTWREGLIPRVSLGQQWTIVIVPLWLLAIAIGLPTYLLWRGGQRRPRFGHCRKCDYNLTGNTSGVCPECGTAIQRAG